MSSLLQPQIQLRARPERARPFLKWAGGKTQLLPELLARAPARLARYHEPFLGGAALFFALGAERCFLSDVNPHLITTYQALRDDPQAVMDALDAHVADKDHYYAVRAQDPEDLLPHRAAARFIFLNRTCFNGLYRVNKSGAFNVPFGSYSNPRILDARNLWAVSEVLQGVTLRCRSVFAKTHRYDRGDFVYFDPPYDPVSATASFTAYAAGGFGREEQVRLAALFDDLAGRGVRVLLSNSDTPFIRDLYKRHRIERVFARRAISRSGAGRGPVAEVLVRPG